MRSETVSTTALVELESRQERILRQLDELDRRILQTLAEFQPGAPARDVRPASGRN